MTPGPDLIFACPACERPFSVPTIGSGNTIGAVWWTDGKCEAPMLPESIAIGACPHCGMALWVEDAKKVGEVDRWGSPTDPDHSVPADWREAPQIVTAAERTVMALIEREPGPDPERLPYLRRKLWWLHNDPQRNRRRKPRSDASATPRAEFSANLRELLRLLDLDNRDDRITAAEIHRELGEFQQTMTLLKGRFPKDYKAAVARIRGLAESQDSLVATFGGDDGPSD